jgi:transketolase
MKRSLPVKGELRIDWAELEALARRIRGKLVELSHHARTPHLGSALSCVDILVAAYWGVVNINPRNPKDPNRDRFILSKGHAATTLYAVLAYRGFFPIELLDTYAKSGGCFAEHPIYDCAPGVEATTGSLGHGLSLGIGMAFAARIQGHGYRVFVVVSDGECNEGALWEAALFAPAHKLDNVAVIIDYNKWQATGRSNEVMALSPLRQKWETFGWSAYEVDGHDLGALTKILVKVPDGSGKPVAIIAHTVKGKGISFMEDDNNWHYRIPSQDELKKAKVELGLL